MRKMIKSYHAYTSLMWRWMMMVLFPLLLLVLELAVKLAAGGMFPADQAALMIWVPIEVMADYWVFSGSCRGRARGMDYLRSSEKGMLLVKHALWMDMLRRAVTMVLLYAVARVAEAFLLAPGDRRILLGYGTIALLVNFCIILVALNVVRHFSMWNYYISASMLALIGSGWTFVLTAIGGFIARSGKEGKADAAEIASVFGGYVAVLAVIAVALAVFTTWQVMHCVKGGYRDEK